ncbi:SPRY domain-containing SOCS box protein 3 isoform X2 [Nilaparvata lugens]|uniref:SPRY domain-containing SOCS box protein 3 isoform X1 n=1 Tax=Nilaparvata lugens TaxID=108931 RepID=UPI00193E6788|nr:SPRY domain-containing SOCS box protein 3 isoform X1 [Nilaparvata lugens]XP_039279177.1 SPRY domain-containing SOCS box protein 3 isoform X2 [Nilaparvata lugens]
MAGVIRNGCDDFWTWSRYARSSEVKLFGSGLKVAHFHPNWSSGTAGVRGTRILNNSRYYWELRVSPRIFGTSMMFGIGTKKARLHVQHFINLLGENEHSWGLSHKGLLWHNGQCSHYTRPFRENEATTVGILFDGIEGTLTFYKDGECLGVAFEGLNLVREPLYPMASSTAAKTEMTLVYMKRDFVNLQDRCRAVILEKYKTESEVRSLMLPPLIKSYLTEAMHRTVYPVKKANILNI